MSKQEYMHLGLRSLRRGTGPRGRPSATLLLCLLSFLPLLLSIPEPATAAVLDEVIVTPALPTMAPCEFRQFLATAVFSDGTTQDITAVAEWTTGDSSTAKVSAEHGSRGLVEARAPGDVEIRAALEFGGSRTKGNTVLTIVAGPIVAITTRPTSKNLDVGIPEQYKARAEYADGCSADITPDVTWSSSNGSAAMVSLTGLVNPLQPTEEVIITAAHAPSGLQNSAEDGSTKIKAEITHIDFDVEFLVPNLTTLGAGMVAAVEVYAYRVDDSRTNITKDVKFDIFGPVGVIDITEGGDNAGDVEGLADGFVTLRATDEERALTTTEDIVVLVSGVLVSLDVEPAPFSVSVGDQRTARVFGRLSSGLSTPDLRKVVTWSTSHPSVAVVGNTNEDRGKVTGITVGETALFATEPSTGVVSGAVVVNVGGAVLDVSVEPEEILLGRLMTLPVRAYGSRADGTRSNISGNVTWQIAPAGIATIDEDGVLSTLADGTASIVAIRNPGEEDELTSPPATLVVEGTLVAIRVKPTTFKVIRDQRRKATAEGELSTGKFTSNLRDVVDWAVLDTTVAEVGNGSPAPEEEDPLEKGEVLGVDSGVTTLTATDPIRGLASAEVSNLRVQGDVVSVEVDEANGGVVQVGTPGEYKARATFADESKGVISDRCEWSIDDESIATVNNDTDKGLVTGIEIGGRTTIRIECDGFLASSIVEVAGDITGLEISPETFDGKALRERRFRAAADYAGGARSDATNTVSWNSTNEAVATVNDIDEKGLVQFLSDGETFIFATAASGHVAISTVTVAGGVTSVRVVPKSKTIRGSTGRKLRVIAELSDGGNGIVTKDVTWTSTDEDIARISDREGEEGLALGGSKIGTAMLTASLGTGESGSTEITISSLLASITMRPDRRVIEIGKHRRVTARGHFDDNGKKTVTRYVEFISDDPAVAIVQSFGNRPGRVIAIAPGTTTVRSVDPTTGIVSDNRTIIEVVLP
ncbi:MAG: Ig-like domain-containing protein [Candidatus Binatia bacterium]|nr:Ig-like domain-containing protein [Candidatus Binatia bacterium]